jgi:hypothetical protein
MNDASDNGGNLQARVTEAGKALGEHVQSAAAATVAVAGQAQKIVEDATAAARLRSFSRGISRCIRVTRPRIPLKGLTVTDLCQERTAPLD